MDKERVVKSKTLISSPGTVLIASVGAPGHMQMLTSNLLSYTLSSMTPPVGDR